MCYSSEPSIAAVATSLGVTSDTIYRWRKKYTPDGDKTCQRRFHFDPKRRSEMTHIAGHPTVGISCLNASLKPAFQPVGLAADVVITWA